MLSRTKSLKVSSSRHKLISGWSRKVSKNIAYPSHPPHWHFPRRHLLFVVRLVQLQMPLKVVKRDAPRRLAAAKGDPEDQRLAAQAVLLQLAHQGGQRGAEGAIHLQGHRFILRSATQAQLTNSHHITTPVLSYTSST